MLSNRAILLPVLAPSSTLPTWVACWRVQTHPWGTPVPSWTVPGLAWPVTFPQGGKVIKAKAWTHPQCTGWWGWFPKHRNSRRLVFHSSQAPGGLSAPQEPYPASRTLCSRQTSKPTHPGHGCFLGTGLTPAPVGGQLPGSGQRICLGHSPSISDIVGKFVTDKKRT